MISVESGQLAGFSSQYPSSSEVIYRDISSENDMTDEESTEVSLVQHKTLPSGMLVTTLPYQYIHVLLRSPSSTFSVL